MGQFAFLETGLGRKHIKCLQYPSKSAEGLGESAESALIKQEGNFKGSQGFHRVVRLVLNQRERKRVLLCPTGNPRDHRTRSLLSRPKLKTP